ncbi:uncharacterized protein LOC142803916 [Rhipicephalus microplus]|uniref:uncharacterized protein LOC142803916 n=1 Tax=Rhipicephalus microplus TaxID=6941 RepID=UPI003F6AAF57
MFFLMAGVRRGEDLVFARKTLRYERRLRWIERNTVDWNKGYKMSISNLGRLTTPYVTAEQWGNYFSKYTEGYYGDDAIIYNYVHGTTMIKKLFEDDVIGKAGLQYLVAWSIYRQLAEFTEPYLFRGDRTAEESCFVHVKNVMRLAVLSNYFNTVAPPYTVEYLKRMAFRIKSSFREALENSTWLTKEARSHLMNKLVQITIQAGSPGDRIYPEFVETFYGQYRLV